MNFQTLKGFASLFQGRHDAYFDSATTRAAWKPVTLKLFADHLAGRNEIGTYPVLDDARCKWGCIDIDMSPEEDEQALAMALDVQSVWTHYKISSWIERSRSKGYHIWTFSEDWIPATHMMLAGQYVKRIAGLPKKTEVNPKNDSPWTLKQGLVNTVRTPYSGKANPGRMVVLDHQGQPLPVDGFVSLARASLVAPERFATLAKTERVIRLRESDREAQGGSTGQRSGSVTGKQRQEAQQVLAGKRLIVSGERDNQLFTVACVLKAQGVHKAEAYRIMREVYREQVQDKSGYSLEEALRKIDSAYR